MKRPYKTSLQRKMIIYFLLIGFATLLVTAEFLFDVQRNELRETLLANFNRFADHQIDSAALFAPLDYLTQKVLLIISIILFEIIIVLTMFLKNIVGPLQHMIEVSQKITKGDLSHTITIEVNNELAELGNTINEMSSNLQEIILLSKNMCSSGKEFVNRTSFIQARRHLSTTEIRQVGNDILHLKKEIDVLSELIDFFSFYTVEKE
jgi:methyl-accepting chemotaxis protein